MVFFLIAIRDQIRSTKWLMALSGETLPGFTGSRCTATTRRVARDRELTRLKSEYTGSPPSFTVLVAYGQIIGHCSSHTSEDVGVRSPVALGVPFTLLGTRRSPAPYPLFSSGFPY